MSKEFYMPEGEPGNPGPNTTATPTLERPSSVPSHIGSSISREIPDPNIPFRFSEPEAPARPVEPARKVDQSQVSDHPKGADLPKEGEPSKEPKAEKPEIIRYKPYDPKKEYVFKKEGRWNVAYEKDTGEMQARFPMVGGASDEDEGGPDPEGPGSFRRSLRELATTIAAARHGRDLHEIKNRLFPDLPDEVAFPPGMSDREIAGYLGRIYQIVKEIPPEELEAKWQEYKAIAAAAPPDEKLRIFEEEYTDKWARESQEQEDRSRRDRNDRNRQRAERAARGEADDEEDDVLRQMYGENVPRQLRNADTEEIKRQFIYSALGKWVSDYDRDPTHQPPATADENAINEWQRRREQDIEVERQRMMNDPATMRAAYESVVARSQRGTDVPGIMPPEDLEQGLIDVRTGYGLPVYIKVWKPKEGAESYEGSFKDVQAKFRWVLRKLEEAERVAASAESSISQNDTARNILQDVNYLIKFLADKDDVPAYQELAEIIHKEFEARTALYDAHRTMMDAGSIDDAFSAVQRVRTKYFNNYLRGSFFKGRRLVEYKVTRADGTEETVSEKRPVQVAFGLIDSSTKIGKPQVRPDGTKTGWNDEELKKNYIWLSKRPGLLREWKREKAIELADQFLPASESSEMTDDEKANRFTWAVNMAEELFIITTRFGTQNFFRTGEKPDRSGPNWGNASNQGSDVGALYGISRVNHLYYDMWYDRSNPNNEFDGVADDSWLNTIQGSAPCYPILAKGMDLQVMDYITFLADQVQGATDKETAKRIMGWSHGAEDSVAAYYKGKWYQPGEAGFDAAKGKGRAITWTRDQFSIADIKWDDIDFDNLPGNSFNIKYWLYKQKYVDPIRSKLIGSPTSYLLHPSADGLKAIKDDFPNAISSDNVRTRAVMWANYTEFMMHGNPRWTEPKWSLAHADAEYIKALHDGIVVHNTQTEELYNEAIGGAEWWIDIQRVKNMVSLWGFFAEILKQSFTLKV